MRGKHENMDGPCPQIVFCISSELTSTEGKFGVGFSIGCDLGPQVVIVFGSLCSMAWTWEFKLYSYLSFTS